MIEFPVGLPAESTPPDQLGFTLWVATRAMTSRYRPGLDSLGLTYPQYLVMSAVWECPTLTVSELGRRLQLSVGTLSPLLRRLENAGLLTRRRGSSDGRVRELTMTDPGRQLMGQGVVVATGVRQTLGMTDDETTQLIDRLTSLTTRLQASTRQSAPA